MSEAAQPDVSQDADHSSRDARTSDIPVEMTPATYMTERLAQYQGWYDGKAVKMKALHLRLRTTSVIGGALVPALVNVEFPGMKIVTTAVSLLVVILVSLESVYHYREQWKNYRSTEQMLGHEAVYYKTRCGAYEGLTDHDAFRLLVERVEGAIATENASTLSTMTLAGQAPGEHRGTISGPNA